MDKQAIRSEKAPAAIGPYSQAVKTDGLVFVSGQLPIDPSSGTMPEGITAQTKMSLTNIREILKAADIQMSNVLKVTVFLNDMNDFADMNAVYETYFEEPYPARAAVEVARLPKDALVEIEAIASI